MARVKIFPEFVQAVHGSVSSKSDYYFKTVNGQIHMCQKPKRSQKPKTARQIMQQTRFEQATAAARKLEADPVTKRYFIEQWKAKDGKNKYHTLHGWLVAEMMR